MYRDEFAHTLVVYCSDGRFAPACEHFVQESLNEVWYDRFVVPGGAGWLRLDVQTVRERDLALGHLSFLIQAHAIQRVLLIAHERCAFYERYRVSAETVLAMQIEDLRTAAHLLQGRFPFIQVDAFYAQVTDQQVTFKAVAL